MIQTIRIIYKRKDSITPIFISEFFKMIGCWVTNFVIEENPNIDLDGNYDVNILIETNSNNLSGNYIKINDIEKLDLEGFRTEGLEILNNLINKIWKDTSIQENIKDISYLFCKHDMFYYLYLIHDFKNIITYNKTDYKKLNRIYNIFFNKYVRFYNDIGLLVEEKNNISQYHDYAILNLKNKLNKLGEQKNPPSKFFDSKNLLIKIDSILSNNSKCAALHYLKGKIACSDNRYIWDGESAYRAAISCATHLNFDDKLIGTLYYILGKYYCEYRKDNIRSEKCFNIAYNFDKYNFKFVYELAMQETTSVPQAINIFNTMLEVYLNGPSMQEVMPQQQIYLYKSFKAMGDIYFKNEVFDLAIRCYQQALQLIETESKFFKIFPENEQRIFKEVPRLHMPLLPIYEALCKCYGAYADKDEEKCVELQKKIQYLINN